MNRGIHAALAAAALATGLGATAAIAADLNATQLIASGLNNPRGLAFAPNGKLFVAEVGNGGPAAPGNPCVKAAPQFVFDACYGASGRISEVFVDGSGSRPLVTGLPSIGIVAGPSIGQGEAGPNDISFQGMTAYVTIGSGGDPEGRELFASKTKLLGHMIRVLPNGRWDVVIDVAGIEARLNPVGAPDSNPYGVLALPGRQLVADAGANAVWAIDANRRVPTAPFAVPPAPPGPPPQGATKRESVTTSVAEGPDGAIYVGQLTSAPFWRGTASVAKYSADGSTLLGTIGGFTAIVDVTFDAGGAMYVLQVGAGYALPPPPPVFPPAGPPPVGPGQGALLRRCPGAATNEVLLTGLSFPGGVTIGPDGAAWFTNNGTSATNGQVRRLALTPCP